MELLQQGSVADLKRELNNAEKNLTQLKLKEFDSSKEKTEEVDAAVGRKRVIQLRIKKLAA